MFRQLMLVNRFPTRQRMNDNYVDAAAKPYAGERGKIAIPVRDVCKTLGYRFASMLYLVFNRKVNVQ